MIDTVKFRLFVTPEQFDKFVQKSTETSRYDHHKEIDLFRYYRSDVNIGSFDTHVNIFLSDSRKESVDIELSLPKYANGENITLVYQDDLIEIIDNIYTELNVVFGGIPSPDKWKILRLDLCYAWKYRNQEEAEQVLSIVRSFDFPRKRKHLYDTSVMWISDTYSVKFYLKHPEFYKHDFPKILKDGRTHLAYQYLNMSDGVVRYEVSLRSKAIKYHIADPCTVSDLLESDLENLLQYFFNKTLEYYNGKFMTHREVYNKLVSKFPKGAVQRLWMYYRLLNSEDKEDKEFVKKIYSKSSISRNNRDLRRAGVGIPNQKKNSKLFDLVIPSKYATSQPRQRL